MYILYVICLVEHTRTKGATVTIVTFNCGATFYGNQLRVEQNTMLPVNVMYKHLSLITVYST